MFLRSSTYKKKFINVMDSVVLENVYIIFKLLEEFDYKSQYMNTYNAIGLRGTSTYVD